MADKALLVQILADTKDAERGVDAVSTKTEGMGEAFKNAAAFAVTYLAGKALAAVSDFVGDSVEAYSDLNESLNALQVQYGEQADGIARLGEEAARAIGSSNSEFNSYAVSVSAFAKQIAGDGGDVVATVDLMSKRTADFASVMNLDFGEASEKFRSGMAGQSEPLRAFGIDVSDARVKLQALKDGIWDGVGAMTESQKVQARWSAIMEQTEQVQGDFANTATDYANAQRIAAAETENVKARVGEALVPFEQLKTKVELLAAQTLGVLSAQLRQLFGDLDAVDSHIQQFEIHMGTSADTAEAALTIVREYGGSFAELLPRLGLATDQLMRLRDADRDVLLGLGFTEAQVDDLAAAVSGQLSAAMAESADRVLKLKGGTDDLTDSQGELEDATDDAASALEDQNEALRDQLSALGALADPAFAYIDAQNDLADAQERYNDAVAEFGENSPEAIDAAQRIADANLRAMEATAAIGEEGVPAALEALKTLGVPQSVIDRFASDRDRIEEIFRNMMLRVSVSAPSLYPTRPASGGVGWESRSNVYMARGGIARARPGGVDATIAEAGQDEVVSPLEQLLTMISDTVGNAMGNGGGGSVLELRVPASRREPLDGWAIVEALQTVERQSGPLPVRVRS